MAWGPGVVVPKKEDVFKTPEQVAHHKTGLKILIWGEDETYKTSFCLSCPPPVYIFDTELGAPPLFDYFKNKDIQWADATYLNPKTDQPEPAVALQRLEASIALLKDVQQGTVCIDSGTDVWDWIQSWLESTGQHTKSGQLMRTAWYDARMKWKNFILRLMAKPIHFIMTAQPQAIYIPDGKGGAAESGEYRPRIERTSKHPFDIVIHAMKWKVINEKTGEKSVRYVSEVEKCRFKKGYRVQIDEITYDKLTEQLKKDLGVQVW